MKALRWGEEGKVRCGYGEGVVQVVAGVKNRWGGWLTQEIIFRVRRRRGGDGLVESFEGSVLGCETAFRGSVDDEEDFVLVGGEVIGFAFFCSTCQRQPCSTSLLERTI